MRPGEAPRSTAPKFCVVRAALLLTEDHLFCFARATNALGVDSQVISINVRYSGNVALTRDSLKSAPNPGHFMSSFIRFQHQTQNSQAAQSVPFVSTAEAASTTSS